MRILEIIQDKSALALLFVTSASLAFGQSSHAAVTSVTITESILLNNETTPTVRSSTVTIDWDNWTTTTDGPSPTFEFFSTNPSASFFYFNFFRVTDATDGSVTDYLRLRGNNDFLFDQLGVNLEIQNSSFDESGQYIDSFEYVSNTSFQQGINGSGFVDFDSPTELGMTLESSDDGKRVYVMNIDSSDVPDRQFFSVNDFWGPEYGLLYKINYSPIPEPSGALLLSLASGLLMLRRRR
ncbi:MAG: PEP-CTERM sorting domain-containing protein [Verrucomicrobiales bacterium]